MGKLFVDGQLRPGTVPDGLQDIGVRPRLVAPALGRSLEFRRVANPHAGCFFVNAAQMATLAEHPAFAKPDSAFCGPLESAATLAIMRCFDVYKPAMPNASFLEVRHLAQRMLDRWVTYTQQDGQVAKTVRLDLA